MILKWHVVAIGVNTNASTIFVAIPDGKNQLRSLRSKGDNIEKKSVLCKWGKRTWVGSTLVEREISEHNNVLLSSKHLFDSQRRYVACN